MLEQPAWLRHHFKGELRLGDGHTEAAWKREHISLGAESPGSYPGFAADDLCDLGQVMHPLWPTVFSHLSWGSGPDGLTSPVAQIVCGPRKLLGVPGNRLELELQRGPNRSLGTQLAVASICLHLFLC